MVVEGMGWWGPEALGCIPLGGGTWMGGCPKSLLSPGWGSQAPGGVVICWGVGNWSRYFEWGVVCAGHGAAFQNEGNVTD